MTGSRTSSLKANSLRCFVSSEIRPRTIWPMQRVAGVKSARGYLRSQFERTWAVYCSGDDTPTQARKIIRLQRS